MLDPSSVVPTPQYQVRKDMGPKGDFVEKSSKSGQNPLLGPKG